MIFVLWVMAAAAGLAAAIAGLEVVASLKPGATATQMMLGLVGLGLSLIVMVCALGLGGIMKRLDDIVVRIALEADRTRRDRPL